MDYNNKGGSRIFLPHAKERLGVVCLQPTPSLRRQVGENDDDRPEGNDDEASTTSQI